MRRIVSALLILSLLFSLAGCSNVSESDSIETGKEREQQIEEEAQEPSGEESEQSAAETEGTLENGENDILVAYFSWADNAILADDVDAVSSPSVIPPGNVQELAQWVQEETGGDLYLFCSHGTDGLADSVEIITEAAPNAEISDNIFDCYEEDAHSSQGEVQNWVSELGY